MLLVPSFAAAAEPHLTVWSNVGSGAGFSSRLVVPFAFPFSGDPGRLVVWAGMAESGCTVRAGLTAGPLTVGPLALRGGLREISAPHASSARSRAWLESSRAVLDGGLSPAARAGLAFAGPGTRGHAAALVVPAGNLITVSAGTGRTGGAASVGAAELLLARASPVNPAASPQPAWFGVPAAPAETLHALVRFRMEPGGRESAVQLAPAVGFSFSPSMGPGVWARLAGELRLARSHGVTQSSRGTQFMSETVVSTVVAAVTPGYRTFFGSPVSEAVSAAVAIASDAGTLAGYRADLRIAGSWRAEMYWPGASLTVRGLEHDTASFSAEGYLQLGSVRTELGFGAALQEDGAGVAHHATAALELADGNAGRPPLTWRGEVQWRQSRESSGTWSLQLAAASGRDGPVAAEWSGQLGGGPSEGGWWKGAAGKLRLTAMGGQARYRLDLGMKYVRGKDDPWRWDAEIGFRTAATDGE